MHLHDNLLIFSGDGHYEAWVIALDARTGDVKWKTERRKPFDQADEPIRLALMESRDYGEVLLDMLGAVECPDDPKILSADRQPERVARIRRDNAVNVLRRHDWVYRWRQVLDVVGLPASQGMTLREAHLERLARTVLDA